MRKLNQITKTFQGKTVKDIRQSDNNDFVVVKFEDGSYVLLHARAHEPGKEYITVTEVA